MLFWIVLILLEIPFVFKYIQAKNNYEISRQVAIIIIMILIFLFVYYFFKLFTNSIT